MAHSALVHCQGKFVINLTPPHISYFRFLLKLLFQDMWCVYLVRSVRSVLDRPSLGCWDTKPALVPTSHNSKMKQSYLRI